MNKKEKRFTPDNKKSFIIKKIFDMKKNGKSITNISTEINMSNKAIQRILKNKTYVGYNLYKGNAFKGRHVPLISQELFDICNMEDNINAIS